MNLPNLDEIQQQGMVFLDENGIKRFFGIGFLAFIAGLLIILIRICQSGIVRQPQKRLRPVPELQPDPVIRPPKASIENSLSIFKKKLEKRFKEELEKSNDFPNIQFSLLYKLEGRDTLIILVKHEEDVIPDPLPIFNILKEVLVELKPKCIREVKLHFYLGIVAIQ